MFSSFADVASGVNVPIASSGISSSSLLASPDNALAARFLILAQCMISNSDNRRLHRASQPVESAKLRISFCASWSVWILNQGSSKYCCNRGWSIQLLALALGCVISFSASVREQNQYRSGLTASLDCFGGKARPI